MFGYRESRAPGDAPAEYELTFNGAPVPPSQGYVKRDSRWWTAELSHIDLGSAALQLTYHELLAVFDDVRIKDHWWNSGFEGLVLGNYHVLRTGPNENDIRLRCLFDFDMDRWRYLWTIREHLTEFARALEAELIPDYAVNTSGIARTGVLIYRVPTDPTVTLATELEALWPRLHRANRYALDTLLAKAHVNSVVVSFKFPEEIQVACEQYLVYFVQFLRDIGIEATANLTEEAGNVLFSVTPKNQAEALDNIRTALAVYLRLPSHPHLGLSTPATDIEVQRLVANIHHLNGQLVLANAAIQLRDNFIEQALMNRPVLVEAIQQEPDKEPVVGDIVSIKKFEWGIFEVDLPTILRRLKELFARQRPE